VNLGHPFSQGTVDSNEIWVDFEARSGGRTIARSGATAKPDDSGEVDPWAYFLNVLLLSRNGERINRRNPQDIFTPLYDHQIPPGAAAVVHYQLSVPPDATGPIQLKARVRYRKFDQEYMELVHQPKPAPSLPIVDMCEDSVTLPVAGADAKAVPAQASPIKPAWQRWNDYGIGCFIEGGAAPSGLSQKRGEMKQALAAFQHLIASGEKDAMAHGYLNAARVLIDDTGRLNEAADMLNKAEKAGAPWWTVAWFKALVATQNVTSKDQFDTAIKLLETILAPENQPVDRGFDFRRDYVVLTRLGQTLYKRSQLELDDPKAEDALLHRAVEAYEKVLEIDPEDVDAHYGLYQCYQQLARSVTLPAKSAAPPAAAAMQQLGEQLADAGKRRDAAQQLLSDLPAFLEQPVSDGKRPAKFFPKLPTIRALIAASRQALAAESDENTRQMLAQLLSWLHNDSNLIYKPDDNARSRATTIYRRGHPAANYAAEAVVLYPTTKAQVEAILNKRPEREAGGQ
jgi:tetratricopeptide (TPR) repeat protein